MQIPEISYVAIGLIARFPRLIPALAAIAVAAGIILGTDRPDPVMVGAALLGAALAGLLARLLVEIVVVLADTLLPR